MLLGMKHHKVVVILVLLMALLGIIGCGLFGQNKPVTVSELDREKLKRMEYQLQTLQAKYAAEASPIVKEHEDIMASYCNKVGATTGASGNCQVDLNTGQVTKKPDSPPVPPKK